MVDRRKTNQDMFHVVSCIFSPTQSVLEVGRVMSGHPVY